MFVEVYLNEEDKLGTMFKKKSLTNGFFAFYYKVNLPKKYLQQK